MTQKRTVISRPEWGIYLGGFLGLGFFSKIGCAGQTEAVTFKSVEDARDYISAWSNDYDPALYVYTDVECVGVWATIAELDAVGLDTTEMKAAALEDHGEPGEWFGETGE